MPWGGLGCGVVWGGVWGVVWCGVVWCGVWCGVVWCGVVWCGVVWCGVVWCGVVWCGVVWCGVVWCGVVWCGVLKALLQEGNGNDVLLKGIAKWARVCACVRSVWHLHGGWVRPFVRRLLFQAAPGIPCSSACWCCCSSRKAHTMVPPDPAGTLHTSSLPCGSGPWNSRCTLPHFLGAIGSGSPAVDRRTARWHRAVEILLHTASFPGGSGQWHSCNTLPRRPGGRGQWNS